jgi:DNA-directed RNA polymerase subunit omega
MDRIVSKVDSKFRFVLLAAHRAEQLMRGAHPRVQLRSPKVARIAMEEVLDDRIQWGYGPAPEGDASTEAGSSGEAAGDGVH